MRVREDVPRWDFPASKGPVFPLPVQDRGLGAISLPSFGDVVGAVFILGFVALILYMAYRIFVIPEGKFLKIQRKHKGWL